MSPMRLAMLLRRALRVSVFSLATAITKKDANHAAQDIGFLKERHPDVTQILGDFNFHGQVLRKKSTRTWPNIWAT